MTNGQQEWDLSQFPVALIKQAPENQSIYDNFGVANSDDWQLAQSIREKGILEPLVITEDRFLLSGHRRLAASKYIGKSSVPVRMRDGVFFSALTKQERLDLLRLYNQQREKSTTEKIREALIGVDPKRAYIELKMLNMRRKAIDSASGEIIVTGIKTRAKITTLGFLIASKAAIEKEKEYWPLSVRRVHYLLLNDPPLCHDSKPKSRYCVFQRS